ncbi:hypothetical protein PG997_006716 [Apiospora hydei]|uniref:Uncharacterized protein n=1 Tax=Apiospora hydei TaxID=1337664 RepID=A0ABR1WRS3_9PEZI
MPLHLERCHISTSQMKSERAGSPSALSQVPEMKAERYVSYSFAGDNDEVLSEDGGISRPRVGDGDSPCGILGVRMSGRVYRC